MEDLVGLDAHVLDRTGGAGDAAVDRLEALVRAGRMRVAVVGGVAAETAHPHVPAHVAAAYRAHRLARPVPAPGHAQKLDRIRLRAILRGEGGGTKHEADAANLADAAEAGCGLFVTADKRILRRRDDLRRVLPALRILTLERLLALVDGADEEEAVEAP